MESVLHKRIEKIDEVFRRVIVEVKKEFFKKIYDDVLDDFCKGAPVDGFRKGKAPMEMVERKYASSIKEEAINRVISETLPDVIEESKLPLVRPPTVENIEELNDRLRYIAIVEVKPDFNVRGYAGMKLERKKRNIVTDEMVDEFLKELRERHAVYVEINKPAENGDLVEFSYKGYEGDAEIDKGGKMSILLGKNDLMKEIEQTIAGMKKGEKRETEIVFPDNYPKKELRGKKVKYRIKLLRVFKKEVPEIDEKFVKKYFGKSKTLEDLRREVKAKLEKEMEEMERRQLESEAIRRLLEIHPDIKAPPSLVMAKFHLYLDEILKGYYIRKVDKEMMERILKSAEEKVKEELILEKIAEKENLIPTDEEVVNWGRILYPKYKGLSNEEVSEVLMREGEFNLIRDSLKRSRALKFIMEKAMIGE